MSEAKQLKGKAQQALLLERAKEICAKSSSSEQDKKDHKRKKNYNSRSRSHDRRRSRSRENKKQKSKHNHDLKDRKRKSKSKEREDEKYYRSRERDHKRYRDPRDTKDPRDTRDHKEYKYDKNVKDRQSKDHRLQKQIKEVVPTEIPMPIQVSMPPMPGERRKRQRSRSPLDYYRRNQNNNQGDFWDSFSWIPRINYIPQVSSSALVNTKKMRRLMITNVPYEVGITEDDLRNLITRYMAQNYLKDEMNNCPVVNLEMNLADRNVSVELSSVEETCRICKLDKIQLFKGSINGIIRLGDSCYGNNVVTLAQTAAQAQAAAFAAINVLENKKTQFSIQTNLKNNNLVSSSVLRVTNAVTPYMATHLPAEQWDEYQEDLIQGFSQYGTILHHWFVNKNDKDICADPGNIFIEYESKDQAEKAMAEMQDRIYDERTIKIYYVPKDLYYKNFKKNATPSANPPPLPALTKEAEPFKKE